MDIDNNSICVATGCDSFTANLWKDSLQQAVDKYTDGSPEQVAAFLVTMGEESNNMTSFQTEQDLFTADRLAQEFPARFAIDQHQATPRPNELAYVVVASGKVGEYVKDYFVGTGPIRIKNKEDYKSFLSDAGLDENIDQNLMNQPQYGALSAGWAFQKNVDERMKGFEDSEENKNNNIRSAKYHHTMEALSKAIVANPDAPALGDEYKDTDPKDNPETKVWNEAKENAAKMDEGYNNALDMNGNPATPGGNDDKTQEEQDEQRAEEDRQKVENDESVDPFQTASDAPHKTLHASKKKK